MQRHTRHLECWNFCVSLAERGWCWRRSSSNAVRQLSWRRGQRSRCSASAQVCDSEGRPRSWERYGSRKHECVFLCIVRLCFSEDSSVATLVEDVAAKRYSPFLRLGTSHENHHLDDRTKEKEAKQPDAMGASPCVLRSARGRETVQGTSQTYIIVLDIRMCGETLSCQVRSLDGTQHSQLCRGRSPGYHHSQAQAQ